MHIVWIFSSFSPYDVGCVCILGSIPERPFPIPISEIVTYLCLHLYKYGWQALSLNSKTLKRKASAILAGPIERSDNNDERNLFTVIC